MKSIFIDERSNKTIEVRIKNLTSNFASNKGLIENLTLSDGKFEMGRKMIEKVSKNVQGFHLYFGAHRQRLLTNIEKTFLHESLIVLL